MIKISICTSHILRDYYALPAYYISHPSTVLLSIQRHTKHKKTQSLFRLNLSPSFFLKYIPHLLKLRTSRFDEMPEIKPISQETHTCLDLIYIKEAYEGLKKSTLSLDLRCLPRTSRP